MINPYPIPLQETQAEITVENSRFIAAIAPAFSVEEARAFIARVKSQHPKANHNVPAFVIGHGASVITHSSDDGEPSGTAGRPALAVLAGSGLGDAVVVVTRYFGGIKLGTGGLVRAYGDAVRAVLQALPLGQRIPTCRVRIDLPYAWFERLRLLIPAHGGQILEETFTDRVTLSARFAASKFPEFQTALLEASAGKIQAEILESQETILPLSSAAAGGEPAV